MKSAFFSPLVFRFGLFEFRPKQGQLTKAGRVLKLEPQPARLLFLLVRNAGQLVTREQIQEAVWGDDVTVDYDQGINRCIRQIRSILLDDAESPRYIKTISRQGYSFIAPVLQTGKDDFASYPIEEGYGEIHSAVPLEVTPEGEPRAAAPPASGIIPALSETTRAEKRGKVLRVGWSVQSLTLAIACVLIMVGMLQYLQSSSRTPRVESYFQLTNDSYDKVIKTGDFARSIFADNSRVYFSVFTGAATSEIAEVALTGGDTSLVHTSLTSPVLLGSSISRSELLLSSGTGIGDVPLWIQPIPTGSARQVPDVIAHGASWSPDGERMVYASQYNLYLTSRSGTNSKLLASFDVRRGQRAYWIRWSPDSQVIRFSLYDSSSHANSLWEISLRSGDTHPVLAADGKGHQDRCCGTWTADGRYYLFVSSDAGRNDIWAAPANLGLITKLKRSTEPIPLTAGPLSYSAPEPSQDGKRIFVIGEARQGELVRYDSAARNFEPLAAGVSASEAAFSRDGKWLAFVAFRDSSLWESKSDGSERSQLSFPPLKAASPHWSPDGTRIAFFGHVPDENTAVYVVSNRGGVTRKLVAEKNHDEMDPDWSPGGQKLVLSDTSRIEQKSEIETYDFATGKTSAITNSRGLRSPRWSPDGRYIAAMTADLSHLMLFDTVANKWVPLANFRMGYPNWSRDSRYIYLVNLANHASIYRIRVADHQIEPLVDMTHRSQYWTDDAWLGLTPQDAPLLSRDISLQQIYALRWAVK